MSLFSLISDGDVFEIRALVLVAALGFVMPGPRWRYFATFAMLVGNHLAARLALAFAAEPVLLTCSVQFALAAALFFWHETWIGQMIGILFGLSVFAGALAYDGQLSLEPSLGLALNYWSAMSIAAFCQNVMMVIMAAKRILQGIRQEI